jgi:ribosomal protein L37E
MAFVGTKSFHEGTRWGFLGDFFELFVNKESFLVYHCRSCGKVEFFVPPVENQTEDQAEDIECLQCGKTIPAESKGCPACGWSWI